ncbi:hypothetical protein WN51_07401 [Melipona quadrifasciata]|uniref:Uncharacterized protein n=1 Tax=Melipona quadrifasciata TaxID=166423 RepID=A0A0M8ZSH9_9HYME|nr:hypothetical protein WN51_07401 [Melipona quadrifasciata]
MGSLLGVKSIKYLSIRVSEKMYFKVHFERMRVKMTNVVEQMRRVLKCEWGMNDAKCANDV